MRGRHAFVVDDECVTEVDVAGALVSVGGALRRRRLAVGHAVSQGPACRDRSAPPAFTA